MKKHIVIFEQKIKERDVEVEDGGSAKIVCVDGAMQEDNGMFVKLQSWDEELKHTDFNKFVGRKVRITVETID